MSQRRQKKQLSVMDNVESLTDHELRDALKTFEISPGPITDSTRNLYRKKLATLIEERDKNAGSPSSRLSSSKSPAAAAIEEEDEDDTSDEDFEYEHEYDDDDDDDDDDDEDEDEDELEEDLMSELQDDYISSSLINNSPLLDESNLHSDTSRGKPTGLISRGKLITIIAITVAILFYFLSDHIFKILEPFKPFKDITKRLLILLVLSPIAYAAYRFIRFYRTRRDEENIKVCSLVSEALELLQSPDNPKGLMPILHIRDTLLTPAERRSKNADMLWQRAVKFIEQHESRVKVELVNVDGEDFRAWKWIGSRKL